ncbi:MAG TPA: hypothetical protein PK264_00210 [Hyphomicrobiaceae bacterium]|nr:hypothetical protein [Hyphomicrobiaceae bacterium]
MDLNKIFGTCLIVLGLIDVFILPRFMRHGPPIITSMVRLIGLGFMAAGVVLVLGFVKFLS